MAAAAGGFESASSVEERKEQIRIARTEVLRQVPQFWDFGSHLELRVEAFWELGL